MSVPTYLFHSLPLKLPNKEMDFSFPPLKLSNKKREEYSKIILFIPFHSIPFSPPKRGLKGFARIFETILYKKLQRLIGLNTCLPPAYLTSFLLLTFIHIFLKGNY